MQQEKMLINGDWIDGRDNLVVVDPSTEEAFAQAPVASAEQVQAALEAARGAQRKWAHTTAVERGKVLMRWADLVERDREDHAGLISREQGKPLGLARIEVDVGNDWFRYYAGFDRRIEGDILPADNPNEQMWIVKAPVGVVAAVIPWNFPWLMAIRKIAPALIAGNSIVLKPHEDTPLSAIRLARLGEEAGVPAGVLNVVTGPGPSVGEALVRSPIPGLVTFTGSAATGQRICQVAADNMVPVSLELGGKAPFIVLDDCDLSAAVENAVIARFVNAGQACVCNERTYVHDRVKDEFVDRLVKRVRQVRVGPPQEPDVLVGPKINQKELEKVVGAVDQAVSDGARVLTGGRRLSEGRFERGYWYEPTVLGDVRQDMAIMQEEVFGPVLPVMGFDDFDRVLALANDSRYGLAAYLFTNNMSLAMRALNELECGELYINRGPGESIHGYHNGWKRSGLAGDDGKYGIESYLRKKTVYLGY